METRGLGVSPRHVELLSYQHESDFQQRRLYSDARDTIGIGEDMYHRNWLSFATNGPGID